MFGVDLMSSSRWCSSHMGRSTAQCDDINPCGISLRHKKNAIMPFEAIQVDLKVVLSKISQIVKDKCKVISLIYRILKNDRNELCKTDSQTLRTYVYQRGIN